MSDDSYKKAKETILSLTRLQELIEQISDQGNDIGPILRRQLGVEDPENGFVHMFPHLGAAMATRRVTITFDHGDDLFHAVAEYNPEYAGTPSRLYMEHREPGEQWEELELTDSQQAALKWWIKHFNAIPLDEALAIPDRTNWPDHYRKDI